jgi:hypothetical protein
LALPLGGVAVAVVVGVEVAAAVSVKGIALFILSLSAARWVCMWLEKKINSSIQLNY